MLMLPMTMLFEIVDDSLPMPELTCAVISPFTLLFEIMELLPEIELVIILFEIMDEVTET